MREGRESKYGEESCFRFILKNLISNGKNTHDWKQYFHRIFSYKSSLFWKHKEYRSHISFNARAFCFLFSIPTLINCFIVSANQPPALITDAHFVFFLRIALLVSLLLSYYFSSCTSFFIFLHISLSHIYFPCKICVIYFTLISIIISLLYNYRIKIYVM